MKNSAFLARRDQEWNDGVDLETEKRAAKIGSELQSAIRSSQQRTETLLRLIVRPWQRQHSARPSLLAIARLQNYCCVVNVNLAWHKQYHFERPSWILLTTRILRAAPPACDRMTAPPKEL